MKNWPAFALIAAACALLTAAGTSAVRAQAFPAKPVRIIVPFPPGGGSDIVGRIVAQKLGEQLKQQVLIDNRPGAGGSIGAEAGVRAIPDGYTLLLASASEIAMNPHIYSRLAYDPVRELVPVAQLGSSPQVIVAHPALPAKTLKELIALARLRPGQINMASSGSGTTNHLAGELFQSTTGVKFTHVPYKGAGPALTDLISGQVQLLFNVLPPVSGFIESGKLRALAVAGPRRLPALPEVPTAIEAGVPGYVATQWWGIFVPAATPKNIVTRLYGELAEALRAADLASSFERQGIAPGMLTQAQFAEFVVAENARWGKVVQTAGIKLD